MLPRIRLPLLVLVSIGLLAGTGWGQDPQAIQGQRILTVSHSFHAFVPGALAEIAKGADGGPRLGSVPVGSAQHPAIVRWIEGRAVEGSGVAAVASRDLWLPLTRRFAHAQT